MQSVCEQCHLYYTNRSANGYHNTYSNVECSLCGDHAICADCDCDIKNITNAFKERKILPPPREKVHRNMDMLRVLNSQPLEFIIHHLQMLAQLYGSQATLFIYAGHQGHNDPYEVIATLSYTEEENDKEYERRVGTLQAAADTEYKEYLKLKEKYGR